MEDARLPKLVTRMLHGKRNGCTPYPPPDARCRIPLVFAAGVPRPAAPDDRLRWCEPDAATMADRPSPARGRRSGSARPRAEGWKRSRPPDRMPWAART